jgi:hypothetical protein
MRYMLLIGSDDKTLPPPPKAAGEEMSARTGIVPSKLL